MSDWQISPPQHVLFQLANVFLMLSYLTTRLLALRLLLAPRWPALLPQCSVAALKYPIKAPGIQSPARRSSTSPSPSRA